jgi:protein disulfide-isomerase
MAQEKYIFVLLDFPRRSAQAPELKSQNEALRNKFQIRGYPSLVIIDGKENVIAQTGYQQGGAASYASHLAQLTQGKKMEFEAVQAADDIATDEPQNLDQLRDEYRKLVGKGEINSTEAQEVRAALLAGDHGRQMHYNVALIDFEVLSIEMERGQREPGQAVLPLVEYLERFGEIDSDSWRVELTIAQVYFEENHYNEALEYANRAHAHAPEKVKAEIEEVISSIRTSLNDHGEVAAAGN